ncbi:hypothetical protein M1328_02060 [Patescibacteria group bacterium]|nr:hypothetical protein [Patescibacteria group bacterium]
MIRAEKVSKEAINRANQLLHNIFAEDIDGLYGKWSFVHKPPYQKNPWQNSQNEWSYSYLPRNMSDHGDEFKPVVSNEPKGGLKEFFSENAKVAVITEDEEMVKALKNKYRNETIEITFVKASDVEALDYDPGEKRHQYNRILVDDIGNFSYKQKVITNITMLAELGDKKGSTIMRTVDLEQNTHQQNTPVYILTHTGWDVYKPNKRQDGSNIIVAFY